MASKGKAVMSAGKDSSGRKKQAVKRKNRDVLQFFEDAADEFDASDDSDWGDFFDDADFLREYNNEDPKVESMPEKRDQVPFFPKEEELSGDELEQMLEERYRTGSGFVRYADDDYDNKRSVDKSFMVPSVVEPKIWKVKCKVGREKNVVFCLIQKFLDLKVLGTKLQIISTFAVEHVKGFVFCEAEKQTDVTEACYQLADVYATLVALVPSNEVGQLLNVRRKTNEVKEGSWARVKTGMYRGDLTQVVAVNNERKRATVKLIPRVDIQALMEKYGGGSSLKRPRNGVPTARLISSRELAELRPLIQYRRDRDTGKSFEFLDGLMLKDGFLFKKVSFDSLAFWDVNPTEEELQKFALPSHDESDNVEWLSQLYGEQTKKSDVKIVGKGGGKGESSSGSHEQSGFEVHDLVLFGKREFGMVIGLEKDEKYKVVKDSPEGSVTLTFGPKELKYVSVDTKFTAPDHRMRTIAIGDTVRILDGPSKGKQGIVKQVYRGIIFVYDENDLENAYFCSKSKMSQKVKHSDASGKDEGGPSAFEDVPSSPKSPLSPKKPWESRANGSDDRGDKGDVFSVGQSLRIRVGPLKGYLCRVIAVRYSEVTVKLDSKQKVLTVKREHLAEVRGNNSTSTSDDTGLGSFKPFDLLGADGGANDWLQGASGSADGGAGGGGGWNVASSNGGAGGGGGWNVASSNEGGTWGAASSSVQVGAAATANNDSGLDAAWLTKGSNGQNNDSDSAWGKRTDAGTSNSWGKPKDSADAGTSNSWGKPKESADAGTSNSWGKPKESADAGTSNSWGKPKESADAGTSNSWGKPKESADAGTSNSWGKPKDSAGDQAATWNAGGSSSGQGSADKVVADTWDIGAKVREEASGWGDKPATDKGNVGSWGNKSNVEDAGGWNKPSASGDAGSSGWGKQKAGDMNEGNKNTSDITWNNAPPSGSSSWDAKLLDKGKGTAEGSSWGKPSQSQDNASGMDIDDKQTAPPENSWGKAAENKSSTVTQGWSSAQHGQSSEGSAWKKSGTSDSGGWKKDGGGWQGNKESENTGGGYGGWQKSENDQGFGQGRGFGGRDRGGFGRGRGDFAGRGRGDFAGRGRGDFAGRGRGDFAGRGRGDFAGRGRGRSDGRGQGSSWRSEGQGGRSSWGNSDGGNGGGTSWKSDNGNSEPSGNKSWGSSGGWGQKGQDNSSNVAAGTGGSSWGKPPSGGDAEGGSSWGKQQSGGGGADGGSSWGKPPSHGGGGEGGSSWGKPQSGGGSGGAEGGSSWGKPQSEGGSSWGKPPQSGGGGGSAEGGPSWGKSQSGGGNSAAGGSSWGKSQKEEGNKGAEGRSSWGSGNNEQINLNKSAGGWNEKPSEASGNPSGNTGEGGTSWGQPRSGGSSWGNAQTSGNSGGGGWGK